MQEETNHDRRPSSGDTVTTVCWICKRLMDYEVRRAPRVDGNPICARCAEHVAKEATTTD